MPYIIIYYPRINSRKLKIEERKTKKDIMKLAEKHSKQAPSVYRVVYGGAEKAKGTTLEGIIIAPPKMHGKGRIESERIAWKIAKHYFGKRWTPEKAWRKRWAFGSYLGISPWNIPEYNPWE